CILKHVSRQESAILHRRYRGEATYLCISGAGAESKASEAELWKPPKPRVMSPKLGRQARKDRKRRAKKTQLLLHLPCERLSDATEEPRGEHQNKRRNTATPPPGETEKRLQPREPSHPSLESRQKRQMKETDLLPESRSDTRSRLPRPRPTEGTSYPLLHHASPEFRERQCQI
ncbi:unnamed protein product, partial [Brassica rapa subsp. trilocularis]